MVDKDKGFGKVLEWIFDGEGWTKQSENMYLMG